MKFTMYSDPGHGWLRIKSEDAYALGLNVDDFTPYSYRSNDNRYWYLEEDLDASTFIAIWESKMGHPLRYDSRHTNGQSSIRKKKPLSNYRTWDRDAYYERRNMLKEESANG